MKSPDLEIPDRLKTSSYGKFRTWPGNKQILWLAVEEHIKQSRYGYVDCWQGPQNCAQSGSKWNKSGTCWDQKFDLKSPGLLPFGAIWPTLCPNRHPWVPSRRSAANNETGEKRIIYEFMRSTLFKWMYVEPSVLTPPASYSYVTLWSNLTLRKIAIWLSKNCQKLDIFFKKNCQWQWQFFWK